MSERKKWDLTSTSSIEGAANWIRKGSNAVAVVIVRGNDCAFSVDGQTRPSDAAELVRNLLPVMVEQINRTRKVRNERITRQRAASIAANLREGI